MKKFTLIIGIMMVCGGFARAQENLFSGGFYAGVVGSQVDGDALYGFNHGGFNAAATVQLPVARRFFLSLDMGFAQKGARDKLAPGSISLYGINLNYVDIPLLLHFYDRKHVGLYAGFQYSRLLGTPKWYNNSNSVNYNANYKGIRFVEKNDYQWVAGGSYYFTPQILLDIRYCYSLKPMGESLESRYDNFATYNNLIQLRIGYIFGMAFDDKPKKVE